MARLEITSPSGKVRETALPPGVALTVGRHAASDIRVNAEGVGQIHMRLAPDGKGEDAPYTVTAGTRDGVRVNGAAVAEARLADGDVLSVGPAKFVFQSDAPAAEPEEIGARSIELAAISEEALPALGKPRPRQGRRQTGRRPRREEVVRRSRRRRAAVADGRRRAGRLRRHGRPDRTGRRPRRPAG